MAMDEADVMTGAGWRQFCERMAGAGRPDPRRRLSVVGARPGRGLPAPGQPAVLLAHLQHRAHRCQLPQLFWHNNLVYRWGGPNVDQNARRAVIAGDGTYRISGNMHACNEFILQVKKGEMHTGGSVITGEARASDLGLGPGDDFEIFLSSERQPGHLDSARSSVQPGSYPRLLLGLAASRISDVRH